MGGGFDNKTLKQIEQKYLKNMLKYQTDQFKTKSTVSFAESTDTGAEQTIVDEKLTVMR